MHFLSIDLPLAGEILDLGGGGEGVIGRAYGHQVTAIDNRQEELDEAPGNFRRMLMDATDLSFPDSHFAHVTAFFTMMYMDKTTQLKAIREAARVLKPGGELHLWDAEIDRAEPEPFCVEMDVSLPAERIHTTYGIVKPDAAQNAEYFIGLCETAHQVPLRNQRRLLSLFSKGTFAHLSTQGGHFHEPHHSPLAR